MVNALFTTQFPQQTCCLWLIRLRDTYAACCRREINSTARGRSQYGRCSGFGAIAIFLRFTCGSANAFAQHGDSRIRFFYSSYRCSGDNIVQEAASFIIYCCCCYAVVCPSHEWSTRKSRRFLIWHVHLRAVRRTVRCPSPYPT